MSEVALTVESDQRVVLLRELEGFLEMTAALYRQIGRELDLGERASLTSDVAPVVRARDQLIGNGPWRLEGTVDELTLLLGQLRAGAELALQRGTGPSPGLRSTAMNTIDAENTDTQLDILQVADALLGQIEPRSED